MIVSKQYNLSKKDIVRHLLSAVHAEAVAQGEKICSLDAFLLKAQPHFLAADKETEVAIESVAITLPGDVD
jgi:hypothetical protein